MDKVTGLLLMCFLLATGCSTNRKNQPVITPGKSSPEPVPTPVVEGRASKAIRSLPSFYQPGEILTVRIAVNPNPATAAVIIQEAIPENWQIIQANPAYQKKEGRIYKWLYWSREMEPFEIVYQIRVPESATGKAVFEGVIKTFEEKSVPICGCCVIERKPE